MKKKVLHLLASNSYSGAENVVCTIINNCSDKYDMYYCCPKGPIEQVLKERNIKYIPLNKLSVKELRMIIKKYNIDIVHAHDYKASLFSSFLNCRVISHLHCDYNLLWCKKIVGFVYSIIQRKFNKIIVVSKEILNSSSFKNKIMDRVEIINNVVDKDMVISKSNEYNVLEYDLIFVGRLISLKQPLLFIDIVYELSKINKDIKACIVGDGELYSECKEKINEYNLDKNIDMLGFKDNPFPYMKNSKILVMPSSYEGLGLVAIESMILGTIVVNSGVGGLDTIFNKNSKYICHNKEEYVECILNLLKKDKSFYRKDCDEMVSNFIDMELYKNKLLNIYDEVLK